MIGIFASKIGLKMAYKKLKEEDGTEEVKTETKEAPKGRMLSADAVKNAINKSTGNKNAFNLGSENPTETVDFIPSGCFILDANICQGKVAGIPVGRIIELAGEESSGKSLLALAFCKGAIEKNYTVVYFCSEPGGLEQDFVSKFIGADKMSEFTYVEVNFMEEVFETIETLLANSDNEYLFVFDSYAATITRAEAEGGFDPSASFSVAPRVANLAMRKLMVPLSKRNSTLLVLNQVRDNITADKYEKMVTPYRIPGGRQLAHCYSLRMWLFTGRSKNKSLYNINDEKIGKIGKILFRKSRYKTEGREIPMAFEFSSENPHLHDKELWFEALKDQKCIVRNKITFLDKSEQKVDPDKWMDEFKDPEFCKKIDELMMDTFVNNYKAEGKVDLSKIAIED
jgi:RecA/RadA recombinase